MNCAVLLVGFLMAVVNPACSQKSLHTWQRWKHTLTSERSSALPYKELSLRVTYEGPKGESFSSYGFWEEGNTFKIRSAFPTAGKWTWRTNCSNQADKGLHGISGEVFVHPYKGKNLLYRNGFLRVSGNARTLLYANKTPFLWIGDTGWYVLREASFSEWKKYIDDRAGKEFTVIQAHVANTFGPAPNADGQLPFENDIPNQLFWRDLETKIEYANQQGLVVYLVGLGVSGKGGYQPAMNTKEFARYITGRLAGDFVIFSPSMDAHYDERNDELGSYLREADVRHLISQHVGTDLKAAEMFHQKNYLDFTSLQSGHHGGNIDKAYAAAREWSSILWNAQPVKPVINSEGMYDGLGHNEGSNFREMDVRKIGWLSWLSGGVGYTYGAGNNKNKITGANGAIWMFNKDPETYDYWEKALDWKSASQMTHMKRFFEGIEWWRLHPAPERIMNQATESSRTMVAARSEKGDLLVAYLPDNEYVELDMRELTRGLKGKWFNPVTGEYAAVNEKIGRSNRQRFTTPNSGDWVLSFRR